MSEENPIDNPLHTVGMPVVEVVAYLTEIAGYNLMIHNQLNAQIEQLREAIVASQEAQTLADSSTQDVD